VSGARSKLVVIGGSAGGLQALISIVSSLPSSIPAALAVVIHSPADADGHLPAILSRSTTVPVAYCRDGDPIQPGRIALAPPDYHLLIEKRRYRLSDGARENGFRPAADPLFRTAAEYFGSSVIGVILSGGLDDGTHGLGAIKARGGLTIVQHPADAVVPGMPHSAMAHVDPDHVAAAVDIAPLIVAACQRHTSQGTRMNTRKTTPLAAETEPTTIPAMIERYGLASGLTCPDCGGALWEIAGDTPVRYQCHVGHKYSPAALDEGQWRAADEAVWTAIRMFEEHAELRRRLGRQAGESGLHAVAMGYRETAATSERHARALQRLVANRVSPLAQPRRPRTVRGPRRSKAAPHRG